jgi:hypothetical protein
MNTSTSDAVRPHSARATFVSASPLPPRYAEVHAALSAVRLEAERHPHLSTPEREMLAIRMNWLMRALHDEAIH